jgi:hypothetical protein
MNLPIFSVLRTVALKPPRVDQNLAAFEAAATTELSSIWNGAVFSVNEEIRATTQRNVEISDSIFDEFIVVAVVFRQNSSSFSASNGIRRC